jgi:PAS domain S-box-containing protein
VFRTDGNIVRLERIGRGFFDQQGRLTRLTGIALEIGEPSLASLRAEAAVRESESRYRRIVENTNEGVWLLDSGLCNSYVNQQMAEMLGYESEDMVGRSVFDFYFPEDVEQKKQVLKRRKEGLPEQIEERVRRRDGSELWVRMAVIPLVKDNGEFDGALAMVSDITERKRTEESLRLFRALIDESNDAIEVIDPETMRILDVNQKACRELGYSREEFLSLQVSDIDPTLDESLHSRLQKEIGESGCVLFERVHRRKDGSTYPVEINLKRVQLDRLYCVSVVRDITERKRLEETLRQKGTDLEEAQRLARIGSWQWDPGTDTVIWSDELYRIAGRDPNGPALSFRSSTRSKVGSGCNMLLTTPCEQEPLTNSIWR